MDTCKGRSSTDPSLTKKAEEPLLNVTRLQFHKLWLADIILGCVLITISSPLFAQSVPEEDSKSISSEQSKELIIRYRYDRFENTQSHWAFFPSEESQEPWHFASLGYSQYLKSVKFIARGNYAHRYDVDAFQFELDAYPILSDKSYVYLNAGYSDDILFPEIRVGGEYFSAFGRSTFEGSLGFRHLSFPGNRVTLLTGSLSKYQGYYFLNVRTFYAIESIGMQWAYFGQVRRYFANDSGYLFFIAGYGPSPDQPTSRETIEYRSAKNINFGIYKDLTANNRINIQFGFSNEEWNFDINKKHFTMTLGYSRKL